MLCKCGGHASAIGMAERQRARTSFYEQRIGMAVIAAIEFDNLVAFDESARKTNGGHRRLGARIAHANFLDAWHERTDKLCHRDFEWIRNSKTRAVLRSVLNCLYDFRMRMAENRGAPGSDVVDIIIAVNVPDVCPFGFVDEKWLPSDSSKCAHRRVNAARNVFQRFTKKLVRFFSRNHVRVLSGRYGVPALAGRVSANRGRESIPQSSHFCTRRRLKPDSIPGYCSHAFAIATTGLSQYLCAIGILRPIPKALLVTFKPGAAWRRLYSFKSIRRITFLTVSSSKPPSTISELDFPCTT